MLRVYRPLPAPLPRSVQRGVGSRLATQSPSVSVGWCSVVYGPTPAPPPLSAQRRGGYPCLPSVPVCLFRLVRWKDSPSPRRPFKPVQQYLIKHTTARGCEKGEGTWVQETNQSSSTCNSRQRQGRESRDKGDVRSDMGGGTRVGMAC